MTSITVVDFTGQETACNSTADASRQQNKDRVHPNADPQSQSNQRAQLRQQ